MHPIFSSFLAVNPGVSFSTMKRLMPGGGIGFGIRFGPGWKEKDRFFREFESTLKESEGESLNR